MNPTTFATHLFIYFILLKKDNLTLLIVKF